MRAALALLAIVVLCVGVGVGILLTEPPQEQQPAGDLIYRRGTYTLTLTEEPCVLAELKADLEESGVPPARATVASAGSQRTPGCWAVDFEGDVLTIDVAGQEGFLPKAWLVPAPHT